MSAIWFSTYRFDIIEISAGNGGGVLKTEGIGGLKIVDNCFRSTENQRNSIKMGP